MCHIRRRGLYSFSRQQKSITVCISQKEIHDCQNIGASKREHAACVGLRVTISRTSKFVLFKIHVRRRKPAWNELQLKHQLLESLSVFLELTATEDVKINLHTRPHPSRRGVRSGPVENSSTNIVIDSRDRGTQTFVSKNIAVLFLLLAASSFVKIRFLSQLRLHKYRLLELLFSHLCYFLSNLLR